VHAWAVDALAHSGRNDPLGDLIPWLEASAGESNPTLFRLCISNTAAFHEQPGRKNYLPRLTLSILEGAQRGGCLGATISVWRGGRGASRFGPSRARPS